MPPKTTQKKTTERKPRDTQKYVRNLRNAVVSLRVGERPNVKHIVLQGRGNRGDTAPVNKDALADGKFRSDEGVLYEIISAAAAKEIIEKQTYNQQSAHPALANLKNAKGEQYTSGVVVEESNEAQGKVVAHLEVDPTRPKQIGITRMAVPGTTDNPMLPDSNRGVGGTHEVEGLKVSINPVQKSDE